MAAIFIEGFDYYTASGVGSALPLTSRWTIANQGATVVTTGIGRYPNSQAMFMTSNVSGTASTAMAPINPTAVTTLSAGFSVKFNSRPSAGSVTFFELFNSSNGNNGISLQLSNTGTVTAIVGSTTVGTTGASTVPTGTWIYFEVELTLSDTTGKCVVYLDDAPIITNNALNTSTVAGSDYMRFSVNSTFPYFVDDVYANNTSTKLGQSRVMVIAPNGDTAQKNFLTSPTSLAGNYAAVNGLTVNNGSFIYGGTTGWKDVYDMDDLAFNPALIHGIQPVYVARKDDSAILNLRMNVVTDATTVINGTTNDLLMSTTAYYRYSDPIIAVNPDTGVAWKARDITNIKMGPEIL